ncbi:SURP and G-patch domain-containing protein 1-like [Styela clava]
MADEIEAKAVVKSEKTEDIFQNDGNFLQNYLNSQKNEKKPDVSNIKQEPKHETKKIVGPPIKKSRFTSMFNQMKRTKAAASLTNKKSSTCFHNDDSSSGEDEKDSKIAKKTFTNTTSLLRGVQSMPSQQMKPAVNSKPQGSGASTQQKVKKKKSRWGEKVDLAQVAPPGIANLPGMPTVTIPTVSPQLGVPQNYRPAGLVGCSELSDDQRKQLDEQREMQAMYNLIMASRNAQANAAAATQLSQKKNKHAYDSDEEIDEDLGTWEHQNRRLEMQKTKELAEKLTDEAESKHFIGDFLPPAELERFMETFKALKEGRTPDFSDYKEFKLQCDNIGFKMLEKMGWSEGEGLGSTKQGITAPVNKGQTSIDGRGVGVERPAGLNKDDDEFSAYRKRMMLAYRFRPNPLNNPRRPYY